MQLFVLFFALVGITSLAITIASDVKQVSLQAENSQLTNITTLQEDDSDNSYIQFGVQPWASDSTEGPIVDVSEYAVPDTRGQTTKIQEALAAAAGGRLVIPKGTWFAAGARFGSLIPAANTTIEIQEGAVLQMEPTDQHRSFSLITLNNSGVHLRGKGTVRGELKDHIGTTGENLFLVWVMDKAKDWTIIGPTFEQAWGDGIYIGGISGTGPVIGGFIDHVVSDNNRRQGISITWAEGTVIGDNVQLLNTGRLAKSMGLVRQYPTAGLDIEPNSWSWAKNIIVGAITADNNIGNGITVQGPFNANTASATIRGATLINNGDSDEVAPYGPFGGLEIKEGGYANVYDITASNNAAYGVRVAGAKGNRTLQGKMTAVGGVANNNGAYGWVLDNDANGGRNVLTGVKASGNPLGNVEIIGGSGNLISP